MVRGLVHLWNTWGIQTLVLGSFTLQLFLLIFGGIRRRSSSTMLRISLWLAYLLADSTAIYALGRLSIISRSGENKLVAFWAPFLLLHLGGPDNITAYALEDNRLWLRHLQTLVVQVLGAAYVISKYMSGSGTLLLVATISMFVAGLVKYGERIWALKCGSMSSIRDRFDKWDNVKLDRFVMESKSEDEILLEAHYKFAVCKSVFLDVTLATGNVDFMGGRINVGLDIYKLVEMELSLMYDILYTKAGVIHTWYGLCIRLISLLLTATALLSFLLSIRGRGDGHPYSRADVIISYVLLVGALVLEAISVFRAVFSSWTCSFVYCKVQKGSIDSSRTIAWLKWLLHVFAWLHRPFKPATRRLWRDSFGQYNLFHLCTRDTTEPWSRLAAKMGFEEWWNKLHFKGTFKGTDSLSTRELKELVLHALPLSDIDATHTNLSSRGRMTLERNNTGAYKDLAQWSVNIDFDESILVWHVATDVFLREFNTDNESHDLKLVEATRVLSNYMMFLLVAKPDMLPGHVRKNLYLAMCSNLEYDWTRANKDNPVIGSRKSWNPCYMLKELFHNDGPNSSRIQQRQALAETLSSTYDQELLESIARGDTLNPRYRPFEESGHTCAVLLAKELRDLNRPDTLKLIFGVWVEMMLYAAEHCRRDSHARQLSKGGEFITIVWLLVYHRMYIERYNAFVDLVPSLDVYNVSSTDATLDTPQEAGNIAEGGSVLDEQVEPGASPPSGGEISEDGSV